MDTLTTTECYCRGGSRASVGAAAPAALLRVFLQRGGILTAPAVPSVGAAGVFSRPYSALCKGGW